jgi:hypothetical protein
MRRNKRDMIFIICIIMIFMGAMLSGINLFIPIVDNATMQIVLLSNMFGLMFIIVGVLVLAVRGMQTGINVFFDIPNAKKVILFHHRRGKNPNVALYTGKLLDNEYIKIKGKIFKDMGYGFRLSGHDCRSTHENISFDVPEWMFDYFSKLKLLTGVTNSIDRYNLAKALSSISKPLFNDKGMLERELKNIELLEPIMKDENKKNVLLGMGYDNIRNLSILCCDGVSHSHGELEEFIDCATPNDIDTLVKQKTLNEQLKTQNYRDPGSSFNYERLIPIFIALFIGILGAIVFLSYMGGA